MKGLFFSICMMWFKISTWLYILGTVTLFVGCENTSEDAQLKRLLSKLNRYPSSNLTAVVVQTKLGCHTCSEIVTDYVNKTYDRKNIFFIVPFSTKKEMQIDYSTQTLESPQILIDSTNIAVKTGLVYENSLIFYFKDGKVIDKVILTSENIVKELEKLNKVSFKPPN